MNKTCRSAIVRYKQFRQIIQLSWLNRIGWMWLWLWLCITSVGAQNLAMPATATTSVPSGATVAGIAPVVPTAGSVSALVVKAAPGNAYSVYATNLTSTLAFLVGYNAITIPADGALTASLVLDCVVLPANSTAGVNTNPGPSTIYSVGIVYFLSSAGCYTKTTGTLLGFIKAQAL